MSATPFSGAGAPSGVNVSSTGKPPSSMRRQAYIEAAPRMLEGRPMGRAPPHGPPVWLGWCPGWRRWRWRRRPARSRRRPARGAAPGAGDRAAGQTRPARACRPRPRLSLAGRDGRHARRDADFPTARISSRPSLRRVASATASGGSISGRSRRRRRGGSRRPTRSTTARSIGWRSTPSAWCARSPAYGETTSATACGCCTRSAAELGLGLERDSRVVVAGSRWEIHTGARIELPLTPAREAERAPAAPGGPAGDRPLHPRGLGRLGERATTSVGDSTELYAALAVVF